MITSNIGSRVTTTTEWKLADRIIELNKKGYRVISSEKITKNKIALSIIFDPLLTEYTKQLYIK